MGLIFSPQSRNELKAICDYIRLDSPLNAKRVRVTIIDTCKRLLKQPTAGRVIIQTSTISIRQIIVYKYRIFYKQTNTGIEIVSIYHGSRLVEDNPGLQPYFDEE